jgi:LmbE family N-acetylglucosaminyl deacetylase
MPPPHYFGNTVGIMAHPDDLYYSAAALLGRIRALGHHVTSVSATRGEAGSLDHDRWPPHLMGDIREAEEIAAFAHSDVTDVRFLDFRDGTLENVPFEIGVEAVLQFLKELRPETVITYGPDGLTGHPDHIAISEWTTEAFHRANIPWSKLLHVAVGDHWHQVSMVLEEADAIYAPANITPDDELAIDLRIHGKELAHKLTGIATHTSQSLPLAEAIGGSIHRLIGWFERESFRLASEIAP